MIRRLAACATLLVAGSLPLACGEKSSPLPSPEPRASDAPATRADAPRTASAAATASAAPKPEGFVLVHTFPKRTQLFGVETAVIACEAGCEVPKGVVAPAPKVWLVTKEKAEEDKSLWLEGYYQNSKGTLTRTNLNDLGQPVHGIYWGRYPNKLFAALDNPSDRTGGNLDNLRRSGKGWVDMYREDNRFDRPRLGRSLPASFDDAVVHAPFYPSSPAWGAGGPLVVTNLHADMDHPTKRVAAWDGKAWTQIDAPFSKVFMNYRLTSGATAFATDKGPFSFANGVLTRIDLPGVNLDGVTLEEASLLVWPVDGAIWFGVIGADDSKVFAPAGDAFAAAPEPPQTEPTGPNDVVDAGARMDWTATPTRLTDACTTPFVILATPPPDPNWAPGDTLAALKGHFELQDELTFVTYFRAGVMYFGVQTKTTDEAHLVMELVEKRRMKPQLTCFDVAPHTPIGAEPAKGVMLERVNVGAGFFRRHVL
ncbi:MAG TPA: hypothetical protein VGM56_33990 [Byssovorax sp.]